MNQFLQFLIAVDQTFNTIFKGYADETLSARAYRMRTEGWEWQYEAINILFFWQEDHCREAYWSEVLRSQFPEHYRTNNG